MSTWRTYIDKLYLKQWSIGFARLSMEDIIRNKTKHLPVQWVIPPNKHISYADPFLLEASNGNTHVLYESVSTVSLDGKISLMTIDKNLKTISDKDLLKTDSHFSYPFIFRENGKTYVFPENAFGGSLNCYEWDDVKQELINKKEVINLPLIDATIIKYNGKYWMFSTMIGESRNRELHIFYADSLLGDYKPHARNPVKNDVTSSRPAGSFVEVDGAIYRPSQNCRNYYGESLCINKLVRLDENSFEEEEYLHITVDKTDDFSYGIHTLNGVGDLVVVDGQKSYFEPIGQFTRKIKNLLFKH